MELGFSTSGRMLSPYGLGSNHQNKGVAFGMAAYSRGQTRAAHEATDGDIAKLEELARSAPPGTSVTDFIDKVVRPNFVASAQVFSAKQINEDEDFYSTDPKNKDSYVTFARKNLKDENFSPEQKINILWATIQDSIAPGAEHRAVFESHLVRAAKEVKQTIDLLPPPTKLDTVDNNPRVRLQDTIMEAFQNDKDNPYLSTEDSLKLQDLAYYGRAKDSAYYTDQALIKQTSRVSRVIDGVTSGVTALKSKFLSSGAKNQGRLPEKPVVVVETGQPQGLESPANLDVQTRQGLPGTTSDN